MISLSVDNEKEEKEICVLKSQHLENILCILQLCKFDLVLLCKLSPVLIIFLFLYILVLKTKHEVHILSLFFSETEVNDFVRSVHIEKLQPYIVE